MVAKPRAAERSEFHRVRTDGGYYRRDEPCPQRPLQGTSVDCARWELGSKLLGEALRVLREKNTEAQRHRGTGRIVPRNAHQRTRDAVQPALPVLEQYALFSTSQ